jgi:hypothetical protein
MSQTKKRRNDMDFIDTWNDKFTDLRLNFMKALEGQIEREGITVEQATADFAKATMWGPHQATQYLRLMSSDDSAFKGAPSLSKRKQWAAK